jgi:nucleotide-binding universal stress UspA family protein
MWHSKNILVGVDLSRGDQFVGKSLSRHSEKASDAAITLAKANSARLLFFYSLDVSPDVRDRIESSLWDESSVKVQAERRLRRLVEKASRQGVEADFLVAYGKPWRQIVEQVNRANHDLVIVGSRRLGAFGSMFLESTGIKLLRKCPCPVLVTRKDSEDRLGSILVANDSTPLGLMAVEVAGNLARQHQAQLHLLTMPRTKDPSARVDESREGQATFLGGLAHPPMLHVAEGPSFCQAIFDQIETLGIELLVLGTENCTGISGFLRKNRAERVVAGIPCCLLALKPPTVRDSVAAEEPLSNPALRSASPSGRPPISA